MDVSDLSLAHRIVTTAERKSGLAGLLARFYNEAGGASVTATGTSTARSLADRFAETINVKDLGAKGDGATDDIAAIQAAHDALPAAGGRLYLPGSSPYLISTALNITKVCEIFGDSQGASDLRSSAAAGHVISINTANHIAVYLHDFTISRTAAIVKASGTAGIYINESGGGGSTNAKIIQRLRILNMYDAIRFDDAFRPAVLDCRLINFLNVGILIDQLGNRDQPSAVISRNLLWDVSGTIAPPAMIRVHKGNGNTISDNRILGGLKGIHFNFNSETGGTGHLLIRNNVIDGQDEYGIHIDQTTASNASGAVFSGISIEGNHIAATAGSYINHINVAGETSTAYFGINILGNHLNNNQVVGPIIQINDGDGVNIQGNVIYNFGSGKGGIDTGGANVIRCQIIDNVFSGNAMTILERYGGIAGNTVLVDRELDLAESRITNVAIVNTALSNIGADAVHVAGTTYVSEIRLPAFKSVTGVGILNGTTVGTDNLNVAIYAATGGAALANSNLSGTLSAGADAWQPIPFTGVIRLPPGKYFVALQCNGTTAQTQRVVAGTTHNVLSTVAVTGTFGTFPSLTPPTTFGGSASGPIAYLY